MEKITAVFEMHGATFDCFENLFNIMTKKSCQVKIAAKNETVMVAMDCSYKRGTKAYDQTAHRIKKSSRNTFEFSK